MTIALTFDRETVPFRVNFFVAGTQCMLFTNSPDVLRAAESLWPTTRHDGMLSFEMEVLVEPALDHLPEHAAHFRGSRHLVFAMLPPGAFVTYDLLRRRVHAALSTSTSRDQKFWNTLLLPITMGVLGTTVGVVPSHCACLDRRGSGTLIAGAPSAGKSTLAAALAKRGFALISDDWTYISARQSGLTGHGLCSPIKLLPDAIRFFPELGNLSPKTTLNGEMAYEIDAVPANGIDVKTISPLHRIFFLERIGTPGCQMVPCRPEYIREFFEKSAERLPEELAEAQTFRASIIQKLSKLPAWFLRTGESPQATAEAVDEFLTEISNASA